MGLHVFCMGTTDGAVFVVFGVLKGVFCNCRALTIHVYDAVIDVCGHDLLDC